MGWITLKEAYTKAGVSETTAYSHLRHLKKHEPIIYKKLVKKKGRFYLVKEPQIIGHLKSDLRKIRPMKKRAKTSLRTKLYRLPASFIPEDIKKTAERLMAEPYVVKMSPDIKTYFKNIKSENERDRILITVSLCEELTHGIYTLKQCCEHQGIDLRTFHRWRTTSPELSTLYKRARKTAKKTIKETEVEQYHATVRLLADGFEREEVTRTYEVYEDITGKEFEIPISKKVVNRQILPNLQAAIFGLANRDPKKWKRFTPMEQMLLDGKKKRPEDDFAGMSPEQIQSWLKDNDPDYGKYTGTN